MLAFSFSSRSRVTAQPPAPPPASPAVVVVTRAVPATRAPPTGTPAPAPPPAPPRPAEPKSVKPKRKRMSEPTVVVTPAPAAAPAPAPAPVSAPAPAPVPAPATKTKAKAKARTSRVASSKRTRNSSNTASEDDDCERRPARKAKRDHRFGEHLLPPKPHSRSSSVASTSTGGFGPARELAIPRQCSITQIDDAPAAARVTSEDIVKLAIKKYRAWFRNLEDPDDKSFEPHLTDYPVVELEYPTANERFPLLFPIDKDDYQPIKELMNTLRAIIEHYLTPAQRIPFGPLSSLLSDPDTLMGSDSDISTPPPSTAGNSSISVPQPLLIRTLTKAHNTRNGPLFVCTLAQINDLLRTLKPTIPARIQEAFDGVGVPPKVWKTIVEECYHRSVGPRVDELRKYVPFSDCVYGELNAPFVSDIVYRTGLAPGKNFVDLGCGVGNCLVQASLQSGCNSKGIELQPIPSALGAVQLEQYHHRLRMWGLSSGPIELVPGDFCEHESVREWMKTADVVLVNNYAFSAQLNERLSLLFLDLPENAKVISLRPFQPPDFRLTERTVSSPLAILQAEECSFRRGSVSWSGVGTFYVNTINRTPVREFVERAANAPPPRASRRRRT
ncbi:hypothetical protein BOTBODRAFT_378872 [Botryobasidium botryosum FD-172 SS1]|uniref:Histone-lysine N-methyltransferase, H3 lysine-79 specific n=1 Tax=Botryobasidium botryosum (strain FD-172 SS1) TaxID=930990 RepID=A0A067MW68_BOTB1|nr:hypothetical protein BOTBODRAFT_378872 [Botryobasidium botryosum FD-172 SS1]